MKITESKLRQIITEEYKKVIAINEMKQSSDYQRLVEIIGQEKADLIVEAFFDFDWVPGSAANKMRKVLNDLEPLEGDDNVAIDAVLAKHGLLDTPAAKKIKSSIGSGEDDEPGKGEDDEPGKGEDDEPGKDDEPGEDDGSLNKFEKALDQVELSLDAVGLLPTGPGTFASLANLLVNITQAGIHTAQGDKSALKEDAFSAAINLVSVLPLAHEAAAAGKLGKGAKAVAGSEKVVAFSTKVIPHLKKLARAQTLKKMAQDRLKEKGDSISAEDQEKYRRFIDVNDKRAEIRKRNINKIEGIDKLRNNVENAGKKIEILKKIMNFPLMANLLDQFKNDEEYGDAIKMLEKGIENFDQLRTTLDSIAPTDPEQNTTSAVVERLVKEELEKILKER